MATQMRSDASAATSPLILSDRLLSLAQDADRAGMRQAAGRLVDLACALLDDAPRSWN